VDEKRFTLANSNLKPSDSTFLRIYNVTRNKDYNIAGITTDTQYVSLASDTSNQSIGLASSDVVVTDYKYASEETEYSPIIINNFVVPQDTTSIHIPANDVTSLFLPGAIVRLTPSDGAMDNYFIVTNSVYDGEDTDIGFSVPVPEDIINPSIYVSDSSVGFNLVGDCTNITSGSNLVIFPDLNVPYLFRPYSLIKVASDIYGVTGAIYSEGSTQVTLTSKATKDYTSTPVWLSNTPVPVEGLTTINPFYPVITEPAQPGMYLNYGGGTAAGANMIINMIKGLFDGIGAFDTVKNSRAQQGQMIVPSTIQRFEAAPPREFSFAWNIFPRNKEEALEVADIIHTLRIYSLPGHFKNAASSSEELTSTGKKLGKDIVENISNLEFSKGIEDALLTLSSLGEIVTLPHVFFLDIMNLESDSPFAKVLIFKPCFLTDLSVTYGGNDEYIHYADGTPVEMTLNVSFKEMIDLRREDFLIEQTEKSTKNTAY
jgi:hypothetical protein